MNFLYKKNVIHFLSVITGIYLLYYIWWRAFYTLNPAALIFSIILLLCEIQGILNYFLFALMTWTVEKKESPPPLEDVSVDVFVPTYNEDLKILEATMVGCANIRRNHITYILDDGRRPEVQSLAEKMGCRYLTREDNKHAKAGNINAALKKTNGEFIIVVDADTVPQPDFLDQTLGYFRDPKTAIVQLPQEFYNLDSVQHQSSGTAWHEQQLFYHVIQLGKNAINAAFWCGSPSILRRSALESIGGVATDSITEDFLTSIRLNSHGWNIRYHHEVLAFGIAPQSLHAFNLQRFRWAQGSMKIFRSKDNPLIAEGLTIKQRLSHFAAIFTYFDSYQKLLYFFIPVIFLLTGIMPMRFNSPYNFLLHWLPYFVLTMLTNIALGRGYFKYIEVEKYNTLKMFTFIKASFSLFRTKHMIFRVTPKTVDDNTKSMERRELREQIITLIIIIFSTCVGILNSIRPIYLRYHSGLSAIIAIFWSLFNASILLLALSSILKRYYYRQDYRFPVNLDRTILRLKDRSIFGTISDISSSGVSIIIPVTEELPKEDITLEIHLHDGVLKIPINIVYSKVIENVGRKIGIHFHDIALDSRKRLFYYLYVSLPRKIYETRESEDVLTYHTNSSSSLSR